MKTRVDWAHALKDAGLAALIAFGLFLPLIGFQTIQSIHNELILDTRWGLLATIVAVVAVGRFLSAVLLAPMLARRRAARRTDRPAPWRAAVGRWFAPFGLGFVIVYPLIALVLAGFHGAVKWIDNFGVQILIYVMLGWGLNIVVGLAGLLDLGYVAFYAVGAYSYALLAKTFGLSFWLLLPLAGILASFWGILLGFPVLRLRGD